jgi:hypothetical protein
MTVGGSMDSSGKYLKMHYCSLLVLVLCFPTITILAYEKVSTSTAFAHKPTTVLLYIAGRNDLDRFVRYNLSQLESIGTNNNITFLVDLHTIQNHRRVSQRFIVYKNRLVQVGQDNELDSGNPETLISACAWAFTHFPADVKVLVLWNHGTGALEPSYRVAINPAELYVFNPTTSMIELNRTIGFMQYLEICNTSELRGICFDNATKHYLTNHDVGQALRTVRDTYLNGQPLDIVSCDACLMAGIEPAYSLKLHGQNAVAKYLVSSQEVVLATGYPYTSIFSATASNPQTAEQLARHFVTKFAQSYTQVTQDYTQSAVDLNQLDPVYDMLDTIANLLIRGMTHEAHGSVRSYLTHCSSKELCTYFEEPSYKDLYHLLTNMIRFIERITLTDSTATRELRSQLTTALIAACALLKKAIIASASGKNLAEASGLSIYLPTQAMHSSYQTTDFGSKSNWTKMLHTYLHKS